MLHNQLPIPGSTSVTGQNVLRRAMGYTSALALSVYSTYKTFLYYGMEGVAVNVSTVIDDVQSLQEDCRAKHLQKHWVDSKFM